MRKSVVIGVILVAIVIVGVGLYYWYAQTPAPLPPETHVWDEWAKNIAKNYNGTTVTFLMAVHPSTDALKAMAPEFEKATGIHIVFDEVSELDIHNKWMLEWTAHTGKYDALMTPVEAIGYYVPSGMLVDLTSYLENETMTPDWYDYEDFALSARDLAVYESKPYGVPIAVESCFLMYRKDLFQTYNKTAPTTYDEMLELAEFFHNKDLDGDGNADISGISLRTTNSLSYVLFSWCYSYGGGWYDPDTYEIMYNNTGMKEAVTYFKNLLQYTPTGIETFSHEEATTNFMQGKSAMLWEATAMAGWVLDPDKSTVYDKVGFAPPPEGPVGRYGLMAGWSLSITSDSKHKDAAWAAICFLTAKATQKMYMNAGGIVERYSGLADPDYVANFPAAPAIAQSFHYADALVSDLGISWWPKIIEIFDLSDRSNVYLGKCLIEKSMTVDQALDTAAQEMHDIMEAAGYYG